MTLSPEALAAWYPFVARRYKRVALFDPLAVQACCELAAALAAGDPATEPAAMFFAFASKRRAFPFAWKLMAGLIARQQAELNGLTLGATLDDLAALCVEVLFRRMDWEAVRAWFAPRVSPHATSA